MKKLLVVLAVLVGLIFSGCAKGTEMKVYVADGDNDRIVILDMSLNWVDSFAVTDPDPYSAPGGVTVDDEFVYVLVWLEGNDAVFKYNILSPYAKVDSVEIYGCNDLDHDDDYVYLCEKKLISGEWHRYVTIIKKSDMSIHDRFESFPPSVPNVSTDGIAVDDDYIYVTGYITIKKFNKSTHELVAENASLGGATVKQLGSDSTYLYATNSNGEVRIYKKSDLSFYKVISGLCVYSMDAAVASSYVYVVDGGWDDEIKGQQVLKVKIDTEEVVATFGEAGYQGSDNSHLKWPHGIAIDELTIVDKEAPWKEDTLEPTGEVKVEIPRRSGEWTALEDVMRIHTSNGKDTSSPRAPVEIGQAEVTCSNISRNFNSFEEASDWYKNLEGYATQIKVGCKIEGSPISVKLFTGIISSVPVDRLSQTAEIRVVDFLDYFGRVTIEETPVWEGISLTQLFKNLVELAFSEWTEGVDYFVENLGGSTIPAIGYTDLNLLSELKMIAESRGMRLYTDTSGRLHCASRNPERDPLTIGYNYNLEDVKERRDINSILNWIVVHARPHEIKPDLEAPGKIAGFTATPGDSKIDLSWSNPTDDDFEKVLIRYSTTAYPLNRDDGTQIYEGAGEAKEHTGLTNGQRYYYSAWTKDTTGNWSDAAHTAATPATIEEERETWEDDMSPSRVSMFDAEPQSQKIILTWYNPNIANFDKVVIRRSTTGYPDSPTSGSSVYEGTAETTTDTGLSNGTRYYYSAFVKNTAGDYSGAAFASAETPSIIRTREMIQSQNITGYGILGPQTGAYGTSYSKKVFLRFGGLRGKYSTDWLRFKHQWDIKVNSGPKYSSNQKHEYGAEDDLGLGFTKSIGGVAGVTVTKIRVTTSEVQVEYKLVYIGGKALSISFSNKLSLWG